MSRARNLLAASALALVGAMCGPATASASTTPASSTIVIGSTNFTEQVVLAYLYSDVLQHAGFKTQVRANLGSRLEVEPAFAHGSLDLYPDYAGSLLAFLEPKDTALATQLSTDLPALRAALAAQGGTALDPAPAVDVNVFAVTKATQAKYHLTTCPAWCQWRGALPRAPVECPKYAYCLLGLEKVYGIHFKSFVSINAESGPVTASFLKNNRVQVAEFFSSDGTVLQNGFYALADNKHLQPADHVLPIIRKSVDTPAVAAALNAMSAKLTTEQLEHLNLKVGVSHDPAAVAAQWLKTEGLT